MQASEYEMKTEIRDADAVRRRIGRNDPQGSSRGRRKCLDGCFVLEEYVPRILTVS